MHADVVVDRMEKTFQPYDDSLTEASPKTEHFKPLSQR